MMSSYSSLALVFLCLYNLSFLEALNGGFSVEIIHRDSPKSPLYRPTENQFQRVVNALHRSINRVNYFNQSFASPNSPQTTILSAQGEYLMSYLIGTPPVLSYGVIDTGSDLFWLQCLPCKKCYNQDTPIFDSSKSTTHKTLACPSNTCISLQGTFCSRKNTCEYYIDYHDGTYSQGDLGLETITLGSTNKVPIQFPGTVIGCGRYNAISSAGKNSGVVGLGNSPTSLITQWNSSIGGKFSYCFVPGLSSAPSKLNFGDAAVVSGHGTVSTPLFFKNPQVFYYLNLEAFIVGTERIGFGGPKSSGNIIIDSGTTLTVLPYNVYSKLELAVAKVVKLQRVSDPNKVLGLCYKGTSDTIDASVPLIIAQFSGAYVYLNSINTFVQVADDVVCFAFMPSLDIPVFGNLAQQNLLVGYDLQKNIVSFKHVDCTKQ